MRESVKDVGECVIYHATCAAWVEVDEIRSVVGSVIRVEGMAERGWCR